MTDEQKKEICKSYHKWWGHMAPPKCNFFTSNEQLNFI